MLANTTKPQPNSKILSIYDKSSSRGGVSSLSTSMSSNNPSQRFSQSNLSRPNHSLFSQSLLSAQDHPSFISPSIDSQKFPFSFPCNSQRSQPLSDPSQNPYGLPLSRPNYTPPYQNYIPETIPTQDYAHFPYYRGPSNSFNHSQQQKYSESSLKNVTNHIMRRYPISQMEYENTMQFPQAQVKAGSMNIEKPTNEEAVVSQITKLSSANEGSQKDDDGKNEQELRSPMDELGNRLMINLEKLKNELKEEVEKCADVQDAREKVIKHFDTFEEGLKQILETYEQFDMQLKRIEEVFMMQTQNIIRSFVENSEDLDKMEKKIEQKVTGNRQNFYNKIHRMYYEPIKQAIAKQMLNKKRKPAYKNPQPRKSTIGATIPGLYDKVMKPFPSYASAHCYETRNSVTIVGQKQYELEVIEDYPAMEIEPSKEEVTQLTKAKRHPDDSVAEKKKQQQQRWRI